MTDPTKPRRPRRARSAFSLLFGVLAVAGVLTSVVAVWAHQVLFKPSSVGDAVEQALLEPEVTDALAVFLTDQLLDAVSIEELVEERLPTELTRLSAVLVGGVRTIVHDGFIRVLSDERTRAVVVAAAERSHGAALRILEGGRLSDGFTVGEEDVSINLLPIVGRGLEVLQDAGLLTRVDLPQLTPGDDPADHIRQLEAAIERSLPDDFGQLTVYRGEQVASAQASLARAQQALALFRFSILAVLAVTVASLAVSLLLATRRRRALVALLLGTVAAMAVGRALVRTVVQEVPTLALKPGSRAATRSMVETLAGGLLTAVTLALLAALAASVIAFLTGPSRTAVSLRGRVSSTGASLGLVVQAHRDGVAVLTFALAALVIALYGFSAAPLALATALTVGGAAALLWLPAPDAAA